MKKKISFAFLFAIVMLMSFVIIGSAESATVTTKSSPLTMRKTASNNGKEIIKIPKGETVEVLEKGSWALVSYNGKEGYVNSKYLTYGAESSSSNAASAAIAEGNLYAGDILFRDVPFGITVAEAERILGTSISGWSSSVTSTPESMREIAESKIINLGWYREPKFQANDKRAFLGFCRLEDKFKMVGGYEADYARLICVASPPTYDVNEDLKSAIVVGGEYEFSISKDIDAIYNDLRNKISSLYGAPHTITNNTDSFFGKAKLNERGSDYEMVMALSEFSFWKSATNGAVISLNCHDNSYITLIYSWPEGDIHIQNAVDAVPDPYAAASDGNVEGL